MKTIPWLTYSWYHLIILSLTFLATLTSTTDVESIKPKYSAWTTWDSELDNSIGVYPNYVWPIDTDERNYFVLIGLKMLLATASETKQFKIIEPYIYQNRISVDGTS